MKKTLTISYANRLSGTGGRKYDLLPVPKVLLANHILKNISNFSIGDTATVEYLLDTIIIRKIINSKL